VCVSFFVTHLAPHISIPTAQHAARAGFASPKYQVNSVVDHPFATTVTCTEVTLSLNITLTWYLGKY